jgi:hypothetical protein
VVHDLVGGRQADGRYRLGRARGIIALGDVATGLVAVGGVAIGLFSVGGVAVGLVAIGAVVMGLTAVARLRVGLAGRGPRLPVGATTRELRTEDGGCGGGPLQAWPAHHAPPGSKLQPPIRTLVERLT